MTLDLVAEVGKELCTNKYVQEARLHREHSCREAFGRAMCRKFEEAQLRAGGNSLFIVFKYAKIETAVEACILAKLRNSGQRCVTANRIMVQDGIYEEFADALTKRIKDLEVGKGTEEDDFIGPLTPERAVDKAMNHIDDAEKHGGQVVLGGAPMANMGGGYFLQPTIIKNMIREMLTTREEAFAPVVCLYKFDTEEKAIAMANDCEVGLGAFVITESIPRSWRVTEVLDVGMVGVNLGLLSACASPFGGVKQSGYGREGGREGIQEYLTVKSMLINVPN